jgi:hypothetical protein
MLPRRSDGLLASIVCILVPLVCLGMIVSEQARADWPDFAKNPPPAASLSPAQSVVTVPVRADVWPEFASARNYSAKIPAASKPSETAATAESSPPPSITHSPILPPPPQAAIADDTKPANPDPAPPAKPPTAAASGGCAGGKCAAPGGFWRRRR